MFSGANLDLDKGRLSAAEVAELDLRGTDLVVLGACDAGPKGNLSALARSFHEAGARTVVSSLWNNSDPATNVLMERFYHNLWSKKAL